MNLIKNNNTKYTIIRCYAKPITDISLVDIYIVRMLNTSYLGINHFYRCEVPMGDYYLFVSDKSKIRKIKSIAKKYFFTETVKEKDIHGPYSIQLKNDIGSLEDY